MKIKYLLVYILITITIFIYGCSNTEKANKINNKKPVVITVKRKKKLKEIKYTPIKGSAKVGPDGHLYTIVVDGKFGFINRQGQVVIPPQYDSAQDFSEGLAEVCLNYGKPGERGIDKEKCGLIDKSGDIVVKFKYDDIGNVSEGFISVYLNNKWGYIDKTGKIIIKPEYNNYAGDFYEGFAGVCNEGKCGYVNKLGQAQIPFLYNDVRKFSEGFAAVRLNDKWGYINHNNEFVIKPFLDVNINAFPPGPFKNGLAYIESKGFIDKTGKIIIKGDYYDFFAGLAATKNCNYYINTKGKTILHLDKYGYSSNLYPGNSFLKGCSNYNDGLLMINYSNREKWGFINEHCQLIIKTNATAKHKDFPIPLGQEFSDGLTCIFIGGKWGFINKKGNIVIEPQFIFLSNADIFSQLIFKNNLAAVRTKDGYGYIDKTGKKIWWHLEN
ncbi:MAG: WG repeat-containing protein [Cyanobacteriota bacterium]